MGRPNKRQIQITKPAQDKKEEAVIQHIMNTTTTCQSVERSCSWIFQNYRFFNVKASGRNVNEINDQPADDDGINLEDDWKKAINSVEQALETPI
ncbi:2376_t:CDS:2 [Entrophospora sp. SA101]|nr:2376_t:CDS:2 [Entrophospora sp. SA101]CAJ0874528.1 2004_t:CDS:2 [Entrophospora sp. SA101]